MIKDIKDIKDIKETEKVIKIYSIECPECKRIIKGFAPKQVEYALETHLRQKHNSPVEKIKFHKKKK